MLGKKGFYRHPAFLGFVAGLIIGFVLMFLVAKGIIPMPFSVC